MAIRAYLYDAEGRDQEVELTAELLQAIEQRHLLWIDVDESEPKALKELAQLLELDPQSLRSLAHTHGSRVHNHGHYTRFAVPIAPATLGEDGNGNRHQNALRNEEALLHFLIAEHWLLTVHGGRVNFIEDFRTRDRAETSIGALTTYNFAASLLDVHLEAYFDEIGRIEAMVDKLDEQALVNPSGKTLLGRMVALRRRVSRLRASLAGQRGVFYALSRPDLQMATEAEAAPHFQVLTGRFERAIDEVEHTRDLVVGSFELFASRSAQQTNDLVKILTYLTAVIGVCAAVAGVFGMNFETGFFGTGDSGFYVTIIALAVLILASTIIARLRGWI